MAKTIINPTEVIYFSNVRLNFNPCTFREVFQIEYQEARTCLGIDFYNDLIAALADYSAAPAYEAGTSYLAGEVVRFKGIYYQALVDTSELPTVATEWEPAPKFTGACADQYNDFFCDFLAPYLAFTILAIRIPYVRTQATDLGIIEFSGMQYEPAEADQYQRLLHAIDRDRAMAWNNLVFHLEQDLSEDPCFANYKGFEENECDKGNCSRNINRAGLYRFG